MDKVIKKIVKFIVILCIITIFIMLFKIIVNKNFIDDYPDRDQEYRLKFNSFLNIYEPYVNYYNYGNYLYEKGMYKEAFEKYLKAQEYNIPSKDYCKVKINTSLSLIKQVDDNDLFKKKELLEEAQKYIDECVNLDSDQERFSLVNILFIIIMIIMVIIVILTILVNAKDGLIPVVNKEYLNKLEMLLNKVLNGEINDKDAYYEMSILIREFVMKKTKINVMNLTKDEINKIGIRDLSLLMEEYYPVMFSKNNIGNIGESVSRTMEVIRRWR